MALAAGDRLGPYEILAPLGAGGMGEVYQARDTRASGEVAIEISTDPFSEDFAREARAVAGAESSAHLHALRRRAELPGDGIRSTAFR